MSLLLLLDTDTAAENLDVTRLAVEVLGYPATIGLSATRLAVEALGYPIGYDLDTTRLGVEIAASQAAEPTFTPSPLPVILPDLFLANWSEAVNIESAWVTAVARSQSLNEDRWSLADRPVRTISVQWLAMRKAHASRLYHQIRRLVDKYSLLPIYSDFSTITKESGSTIDCDTTNRRFFVNGRVAIVKYTDILPTVEFGTIASISDTQIVLSGAPAQTGYTRVFPLIESEPGLSVSMQLITDQTYAVSLQFTEKPGVSALPSTITGSATPSGWATFNDYLVLDTRPDWVGRAMEIVQESSVAARGRGTHLEQIGDVSQVLIPLSYLFLDREDFYSFLEFFDYHRGRTRAFFMPLPSSVLDPISLTTTHLDVEPDANLADLQDHLSYIAIDGLIVPIESIADQTTHFRISFKRDIVVPASYKRILPASRFRFADDALSEEWTTHSIVRCTIRVIEIPVDKFVDIDEI